MNYLFTFLLPSILGIKLFSYLDGENNNMKNISTYFIFVLLSNYICIAIDILFNKFSFNLTDYIENNLVFAFKYITLSIIINIILAFLMEIIKKYIKISIEVKNNEKKDK